MLGYFFIALTAVLLYIWHWRNYTYWHRNRVPYIQPSPVLGNMLPVFQMRKSFPLTLAWLYRKADPLAPLIGFYKVWRPAILLRDVDLIKRIFIKDFASFPNRTLNVNIHSDPLGSQNLFFIRNPEWRELRTKISPVFTSGKTKQMYPLMLENGQELEHLVSERLKGVSDVLDLKELCSRFTTDMIASIAFGIRANCLTNPDSEYFHHSRNIFRLTIGRALNFACIVMLPPILTAMLRVKIFPPTTSAYMRSTFTHVMEEREKSGVRRNDLVDSLIDMKRKGDGVGKHKDYWLAQAAVFQTAGYETSSATMSFALYELAKQPLLQERLRAELSAALRQGGGSISYEELQQLEYLRQVVDETLRMYPVVPFLERECLTPYSLKPYIDYEVPPGMAVYVATVGLHMDSQYWPEPEKFDPERFSEKQQHNINWGAYQPFGQGPHNCIGMRLGLLQTKLGLLHVLRRHRVSVCEQTVDLIDFDARTLVLSSKDGIKLRVEHLPEEELDW